MLPRKAAELGLGPVLERFPGTGFSEGSSSTLPHLSFSGAAGGRSAPPLPPAGFGSGPVHTWGPEAACRRPRAYLLLTCCSCVQRSFLPLTPGHSPGDLGRMGRVHLLSGNSQLPRRPWPRDTCGLKGSGPPAQGCRPSPDTHIALATQVAVTCPQRTPQLQVAPEAPCCASWSGDNHFNFRSAIAPTSAAPFGACFPLPACPGSVSRKDEGRPVPSLDAQQSRRENQEARACQGSGAGLGLRGGPLPAPPLRAHL